MNRLVGEISLVTTGAGTVGSTISRRFSENGARIIIADIQLVQAESIAENLRQKGGVASAFSLDVTGDFSLAGVKEAVRTSGILDTLVKNAGIVSRECQEFVGNQPAGMETHPCRNFRWCLLRNNGRHRPDQVLTPLRCENRGREAGGAYKARQLLRDANPTGFDVAVDAVRLLA